MNERFLSLSCSGESLEKVLTLYYHAKLSQPDFYNNYSVILFYGNNLPKKNPDFCAHGTIGFYDRYLSDLPFLPPCTKEFLTGRKEAVVNQLVYEGFLTGRQGTALLDDPDRFWNFVKNVPFSALYPNYTSALVKKAKEKLDIFKLQPLYLENNFYKVLSKPDMDSKHYFLYALEANGTIGTYYLNQKDEIEKAHLLSELSRRPILSGNSGLLLRQISDRIGSQTTVGYRSHKKRIRANREHALSHLIKGRKTVPEPKNTCFTAYYKDLDQTLSDEEKSIEAFAKGYYRFLNDCVKNWNLDPKQDSLAKGGIS